MVALLPAVLSPIALLLGCTATALLLCCVQGAGEEASRHARDVADAAKEKYEELKVGVYCLEGAYRQTYCQEGCTF
jgi:hypothetical protein